MFDAGDELVHPKQTLFLNNNLLNLQKSNASIVVGKIETVMTKTSICPVGFQVTLPWLLP